VPQPSKTLCDRAHHWAFSAARHSIEPQKRVLDHNTRPVLLSIIQSLGFFSPFDAFQNFY
jgi:hypothetical protein